MRTQREGISPGSLFGWGLSHEIGHEINEGAYAVAEVTNNYYPLLAQARGTNDSLRFKYEVVFKKTTSGARGKASDGAVAAGHVLAAPSGLRYGRL